MGSAKDRLLELVDKLEGGNAAKFAKKAGIPQSTFHNYLQGQSLKSDNIVRITERFNVNLNWLLTGEGRMFKEDEVKSPESGYTGESKPDQETQLPTTPDELVAEISYILGRARVPRENLRDAVQSIYSLVMAERVKHQSAKAEPEDQARGDTTGGHKLTLNGNGNIQAVGNGNKLKK